MHNDRRIKIGILSFIPNSDAIVSQCEYSNN
ncbi:MAG: hypothetical protein ACI9IP_000349 [Arcticibacterium sp.]|jgi:hypothetical protein